MEGKESLLLDVALVAVLEPLEGQELGQGVRTLLGLLILESQRLLQNQSSEIPCPESCFNFSDPRRSLLCLKSQGINS